MRYSGLQISLWGRFLFFAMSPTRRSTRAAKETRMPIRLAVANSENSYLATDASILIDAFEAVLNELGLVDRNCPAALVVANRIITFAKTGILDPAQLRDLTIEAIRKERRPQGENCSIRLNKL
jgi:hypothetical protein